MTEIVNQSSINYLRLFALGAGVMYGSYRMSYLTSFVARREEEAQKHLNDLIFEEARVAYQAHLDALEAAEAAKSGVITDSSSYKFNAEKYLNWSTAQGEQQTKKD